MRWGRLMKVKIDIDESLSEEEVIIRCQSINETVNKIQKRILDITKCTPLIIFYKDNKEYYLEINDILFFEVLDNNIYAHTKDASYQVKYRLYELENMLPNNFGRISKSTIININHILSISSSFGSSSLIEFHKSHKQVYLSRRYNKLLRYRLEERRKL